METAPQVNEAQGANVNTVNEVAEQIIEATKQAKQVYTYKQQIEQNKRFKTALSEECRKLGYALNLIKKFETCFDSPVIEYIDKIRNEPVLYSLCEANCKRSKGGNFTVWLIQSYIREQINKR
jgi:hypothetical protein